MACKYYSTLLYLLPNTKFLDRIPSHSPVLVGSQYVEERLSSREDGKIDTPTLRISTILTQLKVRPGSCPLRIVDMWIGKPPANYMMVLSSSVMGHLRSFPFNYSYWLELLVVDAGVFFLFNHYSHATI